MRKGNTDLEKRQAIITQDTYNNKLHVTVRIFCYLLVRKRRWLGGNVFFELHLVQFEVKALVGYQFVVGAHFFYFALVEHYYFAGLPYG